MAKIEGILNEAFMAGVEAAAKEADKIAARQGELIDRADLSELDKECFACSGKVSPESVMRRKRAVSPEAPKE